MSNKTNKQTTNELTTLESTKNFIITMLPTLKNSLYERMDKESRESLNNDFIIDYLKDFDSLSFKKLDDKKNEVINQRGLNVLYAIDSIIAYDDNAKFNKTLWINDTYKAYLKSANINPTTLSKDEISSINYNIEKVYNDIIKKGKKVIDETKELHKNLNVIMEYWKKKENFNKVNEMLKDMFGIELTQQQYLIIYYGFINQNKKELKVKSVSASKNLLLAILRHRAKQQGLYSMKKVKIEISQIMKEIKLMSNNEFYNELDTTSGLISLASEYGVNIDFKNFNYEKEKPRVERKVKQNVVIIPNEFTKVIK